MLENGSAGWDGLRCGCLNTHTHTHKTNSYGSHTFKNVNEEGQAVYVKYHFKTDQARRQGGDKL